MSDFEDLTIDPRDNKAGDRIDLGEKDANQLVATADAHAMDTGAHVIVIVAIDGGELRLSSRFAVKVRRNKHA